MTKTKELHIHIKRISHNKFMIHNQEYDYLQLVNWFKDKVTK